MLGSLIASAKGLESIDERMLQCGVSRRAFLQFCATLMIAAPYGLAITDKKTPEEVATGLGKVIRPPIIWLAFQDCTGCTESLLQTSHPDFGDLILNVISLEYHETLMAGSGMQARQALDEAVTKYAGKFVLVVEGSIPTGAQGIYMKTGGRTAVDVLADVGGKVAKLFGVKRGLDLLKVKRTTFVIGQDHRLLEVIASETNMNVHAEKALQALD